MKILLADDEAILLGFIQQTLKEMTLPFDCEIFCAENGKAAYKIICEEYIDVAIVDIVMPEMTGLQLIETAKNNSALKTEFIVYSGYQDFSYAQQALKFGAFDYLVKPVDPTVLYETLVHVHNKIFKTNSIANMHLNNYGTLVNKLLEELEKSIYSTELSLKWLCQTKLYINETHAGRVFNKEVGMKFSDYVKNARLKKAVELLEQNTNMSVMDAACALGYENNPDYFIEIFKKKYQMTPKQYQKFLKQ